VIGFAALCVLAAAFIYCQRRRKKSVGSDFSAEETRRPQINIRNLHIHVGNDPGTGRWPGNIFFGPGRRGPNSGRSREGKASGGHYKGGGTGYAYSDGSSDQGGDGRRPRTKVCAAQNHQLPLDEFDIRPPTYDCDHGVNDCKGCLNSRLLTQLEANIPWNELTCRTCGRTLSHDDVLRFAATNSNVLDR
jgi:hypothetical protein